MKNSKIEEKVKELRREYMRKWRSQNKDKVAANNARYWARKAEKALNETEAKNAEKIN